MIKKIKSGGGEEDRECGAIKTSVIRVGVGVRAGCRLGRPLILADVCAPGVRRSRGIDLARGMFLTQFISLRKAVGIHFRSLSLTISHPET